MNKFPIYQYLIILIVVIIGSIYVLPNLYPTQPSIQVAYTDSGKSADQALLNELEDILKKASENDIQNEPRYIEADEETKAKMVLENAYDEIFLRENKIVIKFKDVDSQLSSKTLLQNNLLDRVIIALFLEPSTPSWLKNIGANPVKLGLDLSGGVYFLLEVDIDAAQQGRLEVLLDTYRNTFKDERIRFDKFSIEDLALYFQFSNKDSYNKALKKYKEDSLTSKGGQYIITERPSSNVLILQYSDLALKEIRDYAVGQNLNTLKNRTNELGVSEPTVQRQGANRIIVELPGVQDPTAAKKIIGKTANLEFRLEANSLTSPTRQTSFPFKDNEFQTAFLENAVIVTGDRVTNASTGFDESGFAQVNITLDMRGGKAIQKATSGNVGRKLGVLFVEQKTKSELVVDELGETVIDQKSYIEKNIISLATIQAVLGTSFRITGVGSSAEASELALLLRAGALAAPMKFVEERTVGPSLGKDSVERGMKSIMIGFLLVILFMVFYYRVFGLIANISLIINLILITGVMSILGASLTLPGMAGIVLTVGMAVDANVLIFSRIREELKMKDPQRAIRDGFSRAFVTIFDANVTTLITALILYFIGTGPVKGFAITLSVGIVTSMFTAIMCTRAMVNLVYGNKNIKVLKI
ncbi:MAG: protein translocase subunit SecD [Gammaproteobacteria bacterium]